MIGKLKARKAELTRLREERGATDPILIIAGIAITLILLVGGSFAISGFIANANNLNAQGDLDRIATAQAAYLAQNDGYGSLRVGPNVGTQNTQLQQGAIGFTPTAGNSTIVRTSAAGWTAVTKSGSGDIFFRSSQSPKSFKLTADAANPTYGSELKEVARNLYTNPNVTSGNLIGGWPGTSNSATRTIVAAPWAPGGSAIRTTWSSATTNSGDMGPTINWIPEDQEYTVVFDVYAPTATVFSSMRLAGAGVGSSSIVARSNAGDYTVPANTPTRVWATVNKSADAGADVRVSASPSVKAAGVQYEISNVDVYPGPYQPDRSFFSGSSAGTAQSAFEWAGTSNGSASIRKDRSPIMSKPAEVVLPSGITWSQVGSDAADVLD